MIKKVRIENLQVGMFIHDFLCGWNDHTIFIDKMLVKDLRIIEILRSWGIREVMIDISRGKDYRVPSTNSRPQAMKASVVPPPALPPRMPQPSPVPIDQEIPQARKLKSQVLSILGDFNAKVQQEKPLNLGVAYELSNRMLVSIRRNRDALLLLTRIRQKDEYTLYHSMSVSSLMLNFCDYLGLPEKQTLDLAVGALLHDIGKTKVPDSILNKPGRLTPAESAAMKRHVEYSVDLLSKANNLPLECLDIALHHHEKVDGSGYPHGLDLQKLGLGAMKTSICDVFDAVTSTRCYKEGMGVVSGLKVIYDRSGSHFYKKIAYQFIECMGVYPVGSCVRLSDERVGIVTGRTVNMQQPVVKIFRDPRRKESFAPFIVDLSHTDTTVAGYEDLMILGLNPASAVAEICRVAV